MLQITAEMGAVVGDKINLKDILAKMGSEANYGVAPYDSNSDSISMSSGNCQCTIIFGSESECQFEFSAITNYNWAARYRKWNMATHYTIDLAHPESLEIVRQLLSTQAALYNNIGVIINDITNIKIKVNQQFKITRDILKQIVNKLNQDGTNIETWQLNNIGELPVD